LIKTILSIRFYDSFLPLPTAPLRRSNLIKTILSLRFYDSFLPLPTPKTTERFIPTMVGVKESASTTVSYLYLRRYPFIFITVPSYNSVLRVPRVQPRVQEHKVLHLWRTKTAKKV